MDLGKLLTHVCLCR